MNSMRGPMSFGRIAVYRGDQHIEGGVFMTILEAPRVGRQRSSTTSRWLSLIILCTGFLMIVVDATIVNVALPSIRRDLGFSQADLAWVVNGYLIAYGGFLLLAG